MGCVSSQRMGSAFEADPTLNRSKEFLSSPACVFVSLVFLEVLVAQMGSEIWEFLVTSHYLPVFNIKLLRNVLSIFKVRSASKSWYLSSRHQRNLACSETTPFKWIKPFTGYQLTSTLSAKCWEKCLGDHAVSGSSGLRQILLQHQLPLTASSPAHWKVIVVSRNAIKKKKNSVVFELIFSVALAEIRGLFLLLWIQPSALIVGMLTPLLKQTGPVHRLHRVWEHLWGPRTSLEPAPAPFLSSSPVLLVWYYRFIPSFLMALLGLNGKLLF